MISILLYIDPASTALIWQILAGVLISFSVILSIWWRKITTSFRLVWVKIFRKKNNNVNNTKETDEELEDNIMIKETDEELEDTIVIKETKE